MRAALALLIAALAVTVMPAAAQDGPTVLEAKVSGPITPVMASHLADAADRAAREGHEALLVTLDTPGGLDTSMRDIVKTFFGARVPVVVHVAPQGARATSAGAIISLAANVLAMAPGTNIGAATPVNLQEAGESVGDKIVNDAAAYSEAIAEERGRDTTFAREIVTEGRSETASEALDLGVADLIVGTQDDLLDELDGTTVELASGETTLETAGATVVPHELGLWRSLRQRLADPNIAFLFLSIGSLAILYELANPGMQLGGIVGVILIVLALFSLSVLPVNLVGVLFLVLAIALFIAEMFVPGVGVFAAGGAVSLALAGVFLFEGTLGVDLVVILPSVIVVGVLVVFAGRLVWRARKRRSATGEGQMVGREAVLREADGTRGRIVVDGTWWSVEGAEELTEGQAVRVTDQQGLKLIVEPKKEDA